MAKAAAVSYFSLKPSNVSKGGGFPDGVYKVTAAKFEYWNFNKEIDLDNDKTMVFAHLSLLPCDKAGKPIKGAEVSEQYWSVGQKLYIQPSKDGKRLKPGPESTRDTIAGTFNFGFLLEQLGAMGIDDSWLTDDITAFVGLVGKFKSVEQPGNAKVRAIEEGSGPEKKYTVAIITEIITYPDGAGDGAVAATGKGKKTAKPEAEEEDLPEDDEEEAEEEEEEAEEEEAEEEEEAAGDDDPESLFASSIKDALAAAKGKTVKIPELTIAVWRSLGTDNPHRAAVNKMFKDKAKINVEAKKSGWKVDGENVVKGK